jgi:hypothetical protein
MNKAEWLSISSVAAAMDRDKALISRFVAEHKIETRPGPKKTKLVNFPQFLRAFEAREPRISSTAPWHLAEPRSQESAEPGAALNRLRLDILSARRLRRNDRRKRRSSI